MLFKVDCRGWGSTVKKTFELGADVFDDLNALFFVVLQIIHKALGAPHLDVHESVHHQGVDK